MNKAAEFFENMRKICVEYDAARQLRLKEKDTLILEERWTEVYAWNDREERDFPLPFSRGETTALRAWTTSQLNHTGILEVPDIPWNEDIDDFAQVLRKAGVSEMVVTDQSTALMEGLHALDVQGYHIAGICIVKRQNDRRLTEVKGLLLKLD